MKRPIVPEKTKEQENQWEQFRKLHHVGTTLTGTITWTESPGIGISLGSDVWFSAFMHRPHIPDYMRSLKVGDAITGVILGYQNHTVHISGLSKHESILREWDEFKSENPVGSRLFARNMGIRGHGDRPLVSLMNERFIGYITNRNWPLSEAEEANRDFTLPVTIVEFVDIDQYVGLNMELPPRNSP